MARFLSLEELFERRHFDSEIIILCVRCTILRRSMGPCVSRSTYDTRRILSDGRSERSPPFGRDRMRWIPSRIRTMMQPCASAARLRGADAILPLGVQWRCHGANRSTTTSDRDRQG